MNTTQTAPREIIIKLDKNGKRRAQYLGRIAGRMLPMPIVEADMMIATGGAVRATVHPFTGEAV